MPNALYHTPDIEAAVTEFIHAFALPRLDKKAIFAGFANRAALPAGHNEFAVFTEIMHQRHGGNVTSFNQPRGDKDGTLTIKKLVRVTLQLDFCSDSPLAMTRAQAIETMASSETGVNFFKEYGLSCLYATDPRDISAVEDATQYVRRASMELHLSYWAGLCLPQQGFDHVHVNRIENVDVHHPPGRESYKFGEPHEPQKTDDLPNH